MNLLFTGASGFLGANVKPLLMMHYDIKTIGITDSDDFNVNIAKCVPQLDCQYEIVLHAAGKAHIIPKTKDEEQAFYDVNYTGTVNLCKALEKSGLPETFIFISTVAVYGCESGEKITEDHPLSGDTPYARSKIMAEKYLQDWCGKNGVLLGIIRPALLAGSKAPGNLSAMINGIKAGKYLSIGGGNVRKSILMVQDIANLIPLLIEKGGIYNVCDNEHPSFRELEKVICSQLGCKLPLNIPYWFAKCLALIGDCFGNKVPINSLKLKKITESLTFSNEKAKKELGWQPLCVLENFEI